MEIILSTMNLYFSKYFIYLTYGVNIIIKVSKKQKKKLTTFLEISWRKIAT